MYISREHALEMGNTVPAQPLLFMKATSCYIGDGESIRIPPGCVNLHQEVELGVVIGRTARSIRPEDAYAYVGGYAVALDMTARDFQVLKSFQLSVNLF